MAPLIQQSKPGLLASVSACLDSGWFQSTNPVHNWLNSDMKRPGKIDGNQRQIFPAGRSLLNVIGELLPFFYFSNILYWVGFITWSDCSNRCDGLTNWVGFMVSNLARCCHLCHCGLVSKLSANCISCFRPWKPTQIVIFRIFFNITARCVLQLIKLFFSFRQILTIWVEFGREKGQSALRDRRDIYRQSHHPQMNRSTGPDWPWRRRTMLGALFPASAARWGGGEGGAPCYIAGCHGYCAVGWRRKGRRKAKWLENGWKME